MIFTAWDNLGKDQYMAFQREVEETRGTLNRYKADLSGLHNLDMIISLGYRVKSLIATQFRW